MIICADFDDTIFFLGDKAKTSKNLVAIKKWRDLGHTFILVSGRSLGSMEKDLPDWREYFDYLILDGGTRIVDTKTRLLWANTFDSVTVEKLLSAIKSCTTPYRIAFYDVSGEDFVTEQTDSQFTKIRFLFQNSADAEAFLPKITDKNINIFVWGDDPNSRYRSIDLSEGFHNCIDITPNTTNKANAIRELIKIANLSPNIITVGDNSNDIEMLQDFSGYAIADSKVASLCPDLKTTPSIASLISSLRSMV